jgi:hypothetical protein
MGWLDAPGYWLGRFWFLRALGGIYLVAFLAAANQFRPLLGERGMLPIPRYVRAVPFRDAPSLFHLRYSDRLFAAVAWTGVGVAALATAGLTDHAPLGVSMLSWLVLWALYLSIVNVGQVWYSFGWESLLVETGFLAVFIGSGRVASPTLVLWLLRWLLFRLEFGAGLIKLRGDECWRDLTCLLYHHETQPLPGPLSWWFHHLPRWAHRVEVAANHAAQLVLPFALFLPQPVAGVAAALMIVTQSWLVLSGNFSWLNVLTITIAIPILGVGGGHHQVSGPVWHDALVVAYAAVVVALSYRPARNLLSRRQLMNSSFDPLHLVNTYGAFGSVTRTRHEVVIAGADDVDGPWLEYGFKGKPGDPRRRPPQVAPYHLRLDWLLWFVGITPAYGQPWFVPFVARLLEGDRDTLKLLGRNPFPDRPPTYVRADTYRYRFTTRAERRATGEWWSRTRESPMLRPVRLEELSRR